MIISKRYLDCMRLIRIRAKLLTSHSLVIEVNLQHSDAKEENHSNSHLKTTHSVHSKEGKFIILILFYRFSDKRVEWLEVDVVPLPV